MKRVAKPSRELSEWKNNYSIVPKLRFKAPWIMSPELVIQVRLDVVNIVRSLWARMICSSSSAGETHVLMTLCSRSPPTTSRSKCPSLSVHPGILECSRRLVSCTSTGVAETNMVTRSLPRRRFALQYVYFLFLQCVTLA